MLVKPFAHGKGSGDAAVYYLLRMDYHGRQEHPPNILRGDPEMTKELINSIDREWKFTAGVCSWSGEDTVTPEQEVEMMEKLEELAFAGLEHDQYNILWVRHSHANHHELHFVIPRMELSTGNAFNAFPPGWEKDFSHFRDYMNVKHDWTKPNDPDRKRIFTPSNADIIEARLTRWGQNPTKNEKDSVRKEINNFIKGRIENGLIHDRADIISTLQEVGLQINREGKNYISVKDPDSNIKIRLKGGVYEHQWKAACSTGEAARERKTGAGSIQAGARSIQEGIRRELAEYEQGLTKVIRKRALYNENRYPSRNSQDIKKVEKGIPFNEQSIHRHMADKSDDGIYDIDRSDNWAYLYNGMENRQHRSRNIEVEQSKDSHSGSQDGHTEIIEQDRGSISLQKQGRNVRSISERDRPQYLLRDRRPASDQGQKVRSEGVSFINSNTNMNQGYQNEKSHRNRDTCIRNDRNSTQRFIKTNRKCSPRSYEQLRDMDRRANGKVGAYNKRIRQIRELCQCIRDITSNLFKIANSCRSNERQQVRPDKSQTHDFKR